MKLKPVLPRVGIVLTSVEETSRNLEEELNEDVKESVRKKVVVNNARHLPNRLLGVPLANLLGKEIRSHKHAMDAHDDVSEREEGFGEESKH